MVPAGTSEEGAERAGDRTLLLPGRLEERATRPLGCVGDDFAVEVAFAERLVERGEERRRGRQDDQPLAVLDEVVLEGESLVELPGGEEPAEGAVAGVVLHEHHGAPRGSGLVDLRPVDRADLSGVAEVLEGGQGVGAVRVGQGEGRVAAVAARATSTSGRLAPARSEKAECTFRWTKGSSRRAASGAEARRRGSSAGSARWRFRARRRRTRGGRAPGPGVPSSRSVRRPGASEWPKGSCSCRSCTSTRSCRTTPTRRSADATLVALSPEVRDGGEDVVVAVGGAGEAAADLHGLEVRVAEPHADRACERALLPEGRAGALGQVREHGVDEALVGGVPREGGLARDGPGLAARCRPTGIRVLAGAESPGPAGEGRAGAAEGLLQDVRRNGGEVARRCGG